MRAPLVAACTSDEPHGCSRRVPDDSSLEKLELRVAAGTPCPRVRGLGRLGRLMLLGAAIHQSSCSAATQPRPAGGACSGQRVLVIHNQTGGPLDIYMFAARQSAQLIGFVDPGQSELVLPPTAPSAAAYHGRRPGTGTPFGPPRFTYYVQCR